MSPIASYGRAGLDPRRPSLAMRLALGLLHAGVLIREGTPDRGHVWRGRAYPAQAVLDITIDGLVARGLATRRTMPGLYDQPRSLVEITALGEAAYRGGPLTPRRRPPPAAEAVLRDIERALTQLDAESVMLNRDLLALSLGVRESARTLAGIEARLAKLERGREQLDRVRTDLRAVLAHAGERLGEVLAEARS